ncbi:MAG TPA: aspartyl protease family protein [Phenylobacterium sp.]|jgi:tetratricopeptide (TPR) repeat protein/predicted aspartyl protease|uniref:aspartyl protease family protein n=1 Tax=Phenylobacterium sp. TaxID=1871053 RepID=UPI002B653761|nr:aspartyl protease family protein [Phenylobacterium sp.]HXA39510.1 aspartyl protease family protein [Phenylobacterium sp.]
MKARTRALALAAAAALVAAAPAAQAECKFEKFAEIPVTMEGLRPTMIAQINGQDAKFLVDTGAFFSGVTPDTSARYGMKRSVAPFGMTVQGVGGQKRDIQAVAADNFTFAGVGFRNTQFVVLGRIGGDGIVGNIGENLMGPFDVEYDLANGAIRYFKATGCGYDANLAYWSKGLAVSRVSIIDPTRILLKVVTSAKVDGHTIRVTFDSGSSLSVMSRNAAARAGIQIGSEGVVSGGITYGIYGKGLESFLAPFASFAIGDEEIKNTRLRISDIELPDSDMLLGADFFLSHRILISNSQKKVYFTYNGGPVFRLDQAAQRLAQGGSTPAPPPASGVTPGAVATATAPAPAIPGEQPKTAAEFARRASAEAARREFQAAIADDTRAIELEPDNGRHYRARAMARLAARQPVLAMADLDEALKRQPDDPEALMRRGELYLASRDLARAKSDFEAAFKLAPADSSLVATAGVAYARAGQYESAIRQLDTWIAAHPKDEDLPRALSARCYSRAAWGKELEMALADCDAALRRDRTSEVMTYRGLVLLRLGRLDEAIVQYTAAIKSQPRAAQALYGRGLAELKKGQKAEGDADLAAALAIGPGLAAEYQRLGLAPEAAGPPAKS